MSINAKDTKTTTSMITDNNKEFEQIDQLSKIKPTTCFEIMNKYPICQEFSNHIVSLDELGPEHSFGDNFLTLNEIFGYAPNTFDDYKLHKIKSDGFTLPPQYLVGHVMPEVPREVPREISKEVSRKVPRKNIKKKVKIVKTSKCLSKKIQK